MKSRLSVLATNAARAEHEQGRGSEGEDSVPRLSS